jgi:hypothetical protein
MPIEFVLVFSQLNWCPETAEEGVDISRQLNHFGGEDEVAIVGSTHSGRT